MSPRLPASSAPTLRLAADADYPAIRIISDMALGAGYFTPERTDTLLVCERDGAVAGFCYGYTLRLADVRTQVLKGLDFPDFNASPETLVGVLQTIAVSANHTREGLGQLLAEGLLRSLGSPPVLLSPAWRQPGGKVNAAQVLSRVGMAALASYPDFWLAESRQRGYFCPWCGNPCRCEMVLFGSGPSTV